MNLIAQLAIGDRRTNGASAQVTQAILENPKLIDAVFDAIWQSDDAGVRMRASNVCETVSRTRPETLTASGTPAMRARGKKLLKELK